jgi:hypothetical protein
MSDTFTTPTLHLEPNSRSTPSSSWTSSGKSPCERDLAQHLRWRSAIPRPGRPSTPAPEFRVGSCMHGYGVSVGGRHWAATLGGDHDLIGRCARKDLVPGRSRAGQGARLLTRQFRSPRSSRRPGASMRYSPREWARDVRCASPRMNRHAPRRRPHARVARRARVRRPR